MVQAVELMISNYFSIPYQNFTEKIISALGFLNSIVVDFTGDDLKELNNDISRINLLINITSDKLYINFFSIDRWINPLGVLDKKIIFSISDKASIKYINKYKRSREFSKLNGDDYFLQKYCCDVILEVNNIVMKYLYDYSRNIKTKGDNSW